MGIHKLNYIINKFNICTNDNLENIIKTIKKSLGYSNNQIIFIGIDTSLYINKIIHNNINHKNEFIYYFFYQIQNFLKFKVIPVYIFDTSHSEFKNNEIIKRKNNIDKSKNKINDILNDDNISNDNDEENYIKLLKLKKKIIRPSTYNYDTLKNLLTYFSIPWLNAIDEADFTLVSLYHNNIIQAILSDDNDFLLFQCNNVIKKINNNFTLTNYTDIVNTLNINYDQFINLCIKLGTEYNDNFTTVPQINELLSNIDNIKSITLDSEDNKVYNIITIINNNIKSYDCNQFSFINKSKYDYKTIFFNFNRNKLIEFLNNIDI